MEHIAIIGKGSVGRALDQRFKHAGFEVVFGTRTQHGNDEHPVGDAIAACGVIILALPYLEAVQLVSDYAIELVGKIIIDVTNPLASDWSPLPMNNGSAAEVIASRAERAIIVKSFNTIFADVMARAENGSTTFIASDDSNAAALVLELANAAGFAPVFVGPLVQARHLEALAHLNIAIALGQNGGTSARFQFERLG
jgi:8-hydroxy-5-deazaflavin:NADPH oxidoreductase